MKKIFCLLLSVLLIFSLAACTAQDGTDIETSGTTNAGSAAPAQGKVLVVYFSATGTTKRVAEMIASTTNADIFELTPADPYTSDDLNYNDRNSRVYKEHADASMRDIKLTADTVENFAQYDTVYIGYPIWWGEAAWPVNSFVKANDFSGKTVIPFCTSASSGVGDSAKALKELAKGGNWKDGTRFSGSTDSNDIAEWISAGNAQ